VKIQMNDIQINDIMNRTETSTGNVLDKIIEQKRIRLKEEMEKISTEELKQRLKRPGVHCPLNFYDSIKKNNNGRIAIIGEIKKASPSKGLIKEDFDPVLLAKEYMASDVQAVSVLTEKDYFSGSDEHLAKVRQVCTKPVLRKDFIIDIWQIYQSRCLGADAILLIASVLSDEQLNKFQIVAGILGMQCLVEVHNMHDLERALESGAKIIGINNRDLETFQVDIRTTERLINSIPSDRVVVSESGISTSEDLEYLDRLGVDAVLVGESLMRAPSINEKLRELRNYGPEKGGVL